MGGCEARRFLAGLVNETCMRTIGVVTAARSDYGIYLPILRLIHSDSELKLYLIVTGAHLSPDFGMTVQGIEADGFEVSERIEMLLSSDTSEGVAKSMGLGTIGFAQSYARFRPDILLVLGDRYEMHAAVVAAVPFKIPVAHIHGGESTEGAIDELFRHSITKLSHLHFVSTEFYGQRLIQMGEEPWRVVVSGAPSLDNLRTVPLLDEEEIERRSGIKLSERTLLVTYHPVTLEYEETRQHMQALLGALEAAGCPVIFTYPGADTGGRLIIDMIQEFAAHYQAAQVVDNLGTQLYFSLMNKVAAMVGNSSSGIIEAASFKLPVVNIGNRQRGRVHGANVLNVGDSQEEIIVGIQKALSAELRASLTNMRNPYGDGHAAPRIVQCLKEAPLNHSLIVKSFYGGDRAHDH